MRKHKQTGRRVMSLLVLALALLFLGCPNPTSTSSDAVDGGGGGTSGGATAADRSIDDATTALDAGDYDAAYQAYQNALDADPSNMSAILGVTALELLNMTVDDDLRQLMTGPFGVENYPTTFDSFLAGDHIVEVGDDEFVDIAGQEDLNGDEFIDMEERVLALMENVFTSGNDLGNRAVDLLDDTMGDVLGNAVSRLTAVETGASLEVTPDLVGLGSWPEGISTNPRIGKAEVLLLAAQLESLRAMLKFSQAIEYSLPLDDFWAAFPSDSHPETWDIDTLETPEANVFSEGLFTTTPDADSQWSDARDIVISSLNHRNDAIDIILARTTEDDFVFSPGSPFLPYETGESSPWVGSVEWDHVEQALNVMRIGGGRLVASANDQSGATPAIFPIITDDGADPQELLSEYSDENNWPDSSDIVFDPNLEVPVANSTAGAINLGSFLATPVAPAEVLIQMRTDDAGEPQLYTYNGSSFASTTTYNPNTTYYVQIPDATLGGLFDPSNLNGIDIAALNDWLADEDAGTIVRTTESPSGDVVGVEVYAEQSDNESVGNSLVPRGQTFTVYDDGSTVTYESSGSFWQIGDVASSVTSTE